MDAAALQRFVDAVCCKYAQTPLTILIIPYGEALIHSYYWKALAKLTSCDHILAVGCQTNLSFSIETMLQHFTHNGGCKEKLRLWCTFHGSMTSEEAFAAQCHSLKNQRIAFSAGAVGDPSQLEAMVRLRKLLPDSVYLWINRMDGLKRAYTAEEQQIFTAIDPYFPLELEEPPADMRKCTGGRQSLFVRGDGSCYSCNLSRRRLGNFYEDDWQGQWTHMGCSVKRCHCHLSCSNRVDRPAWTFFDWHPSFRQPIFDTWLPYEKRQVQAIFFDLDGTLTGHTDGSPLRRQFAAALPLLAKEYPLYLATLRPERDALRLCGDCSQYISGGVFADGSYLRINRQTPPVITPLMLDTKTQEALNAIANKRHLQQRSYHYRQTPYKITFFSRANQPISQATVDLIQRAATNSHIEATGKTVGLVSPLSSKWNGMLRLLETLKIHPSRIAYVGDAASDAVIFQKLRCSIALADSHPAAQAAARFRIGLLSHEST